MRQNETISNIKRKTGAKGITIVSKNTKPRYM